MLQACDPPQFRCTRRFEAQAFRRGWRVVAGCDEVGRGALLGPLYAAAVILDPAQPIPGLDDSKKLSPDERIVLDDTQVLSVLEKMIKQRKESLVQFQAGNRQDLVEKEAAEITLLLGYLPSQLTAAEIETLKAQAEVQPLVSLASQRPPGTLIT